MGLVATSVLGLSACGAKQDEDNKNKYYIEGLQTVCELTEEFIVVGKTLNIPMPDGTTKEVTITPEMVKQTIDTSLTIGEQTLIVEYEGVEYKFTIEVMDSVTNYSFDGRMDWFVNDIFNINMIYMTVEWKSGNAEMINLNPDMIVEAPDMRFAGDKTVTIKFNNKEYQFTITVNAVN